MTGFEPGLPAAPLPPELTPVGQARDWRRLDARMLLIHPVVEVGRYLPALVAVFFFGGGSGGGQGSYWSLIGLAAVLGRAMLLWFTTRYRITASQIELRRGLLRRRTLTASLDRVRTVDVTAHALHRALGLAKVSVGTGVSDRSDRSGHSGLTLDGLDARAATRLRGELLHRVRPGEPATSRGAPAGGSTAGGSTAGGSTAQRTTVQDAGIEGGPDDVTAPESLIVALRTGWVRYAPFTLSGAITVLALAGFVWRIQNESGANLERLGVLRHLVTHLRRLPAWRLTAELGLAAVVVMALASTVGYVLAFWHFRLTRHPGGTVHISRGLLTTRATSIEERRLRGASISEPILLRMVGGARVIAIATGLRVGRGAERGGTVLLPPAPRAVAIDVAASVTGRRQPFVADLRRHGRAATRRRYTRALSAGLLVAITLGAATNFSGGRVLATAAAGLTLLTAGLLARDRAANLGHAVVDGFLVARFGSFDRRRAVIAADGVIGFTWRRSFLQRRAGVVTLIATTAAGRQSYPVVDVDPAEAFRTAIALRPGLVEQFSTAAAGAPSPRGEARSRTGGTGEVA